MAINTNGTQDLENEIYLNGEEGTDLSNYYTKQETYSQIEVDNLFSEMGVDLESALGGYYQKSETYSQAEVDTLISMVDSLSTDDVYLKTEVYNKEEVDNAIEEIDVVSLVTSVNGKQGDVVIGSSDIEGLDVTLNGFADRLEELELQDTLLHLRGVLESEEELPDTPTLGDLYLIDVDSINYYVAIYSGVEWKFVGKGQDLSEYAKLENVYTKDVLYTKDEVDNILTNYFTKTEISVVLEEYVNTDELNTTLENYYTKEEVDNNLGNIVSGVSSFNGATGDIIANGTTLEIEPGGSTIKEYIDNSGTPGGGISIEYSNEDVITLLVDTANIEANGEVIYPTYNGNLFKTSGGEITMLQDVELLEVTPNFIFTAVETLIIYVNGVSKSYFNSSQIVAPFFLIDLKKDDVINIRSTSSAGYFSNYESKIMIRALVEKNVLNLQDVVTTHDIESYSKRNQIYGLSIDNLPLTGGTWQTLPITLTNESFFNTMIGEDFATISEDGVLLLNSDIASTMDHARIQGTGYITGASQDVYCRVILSPPGATDVTEDFVDFTSSILLGEVGVAKALNRDIINLTCRDLISKLATGVERGNYEIRLQMYSTSSYLVDELVLDFNVKPL